jgi:hypothetical protein
MRRPRPYSCVHSLRQLLTADRGDLRSTARLVDQEEDGSLTIRDRSKCEEEGTGDVMRIGTTPSQSGSIPTTVSAATVPAASTAPRSDAYLLIVYLRVNRCPTASQRPSSAQTELALTIHSRTRRAAKRRAPSAWPSSAHPYPRHHLSSPLQYRHSLYILFRRLSRRKCRPVIWGRTRACTTYPPVSTGWSWRSGATANPGPASRRASQQIRAPRTSPVPHLPARRGCRRKSGTGRQRGCRGTG